MTHSEYIKDLERRNAALGNLLDHCGSPSPTLRDQFAMAALHAYKMENAGVDDEILAGWCYSLADAMMEARKESNDE